MNTPVSFPIAMLLKEKGFDEVCQKWYSVEGGLYYQDEFDNNRGFIPVCECEAPTVAEVVMWLYEKHGIWISVQPNEPYVDNDWCFSIFKDLIKNTSLEGYDSPTEACEAGIIYALNNLI